MWMITDIILLHVYRPWSDIFNCNLSVWPWPWLFSSPEPKARVSYCHSASSVRPSSINFHIFDFFSRTAWWILIKLGRDEVLVVPYKCCCFSARSPQGRIQGGAKLGHGGSLLQKTSSSDRKATATNRMDSNDLEACGKKCCYFWFHSEVKFLTRFWRLFGLLHFALFLSNFYGFLCGKVFNLHLFCVISMFVSGRMLI